MFISICQHLLVLLLDFAAFLDNIRLICDERQASDLTYCVSMCRIKQYMFYSFSIIREVSLSVIINRDSKVAIEADLTEHLLKYL